MTSRRERARRRLRRHGFEPVTLTAPDQGAKAVIFLAECAETDCVVKWSSGKRPRADYVAEWHLQSTVLAGTAVPAPETYAAEDPRDGSFYHVMEAMTSDRPDDRWASESFLPSVAADAGRVFSRLHAIDADAVGGLPGRTGDPLAHVSDRFDYVHRKIQDTPAEAYDDDLRRLERTYERLAEPDRRALVHGDPMSENVLFDADGTIAGLIDWESAALSDPLVDLATFVVQVPTSFSVFGPHDPDDLAATLLEAYAGSVDRRRLRVLRVVENLALAAGVHEVGHFVPWRRIRDRTDISAVQFHLDRAATLLDRLETA